MANKTTKAQRRAAKLNRRSKAYRKKIAAAEKKTSSEKVKNPTPKKVYTPVRVPAAKKVEFYDTEFDSSTHNLYYIFVVDENKDDELQCQVAAVPKGKSISESYEVLEIANGNDGRHAITIKLPEHFDLELAATLAYDDVTACAMRYVIDDYMVGEGIKVWGMSFDDFSSICAFWRACQVTDENEWISKYYAA